MRPTKLSKIVGIALGVGIMLTFGAFQNCGRTGGFKPKNTARDSSPDNLVGPNLDRDLAQAQTYANTALTDLLKKFWVGTAEQGHIATTWNGYLQNWMPAGIDPQLAIIPNWASSNIGSLWDRSSLFAILYFHYKATGSSSSISRMKAEWDYVKSAGISDYPSCGSGRWAQDDLGVFAIYFAQAYEITGDPDALALAKQSVKCAFERWEDGQFGGGLWYNDQKNIKSLYQTHLAYAALLIYLLSKDELYWSYGTGMYLWMEDKLLREDNLYWCDYGWYSPTGFVDKNQPPSPIGDLTNIYQAGSSTYLGGVMGMGVLHAIIFKITKETKYRDRALRTAKALLLTPLTGPDGVYTNDRDGWTNGNFASAWAQWVLPLLTDQQAARSTIKTANAIFQNARTSDGFYGANWSGNKPYLLLSSERDWTNHGTFPQQITTSASGVNNLIATLFLKAHDLL